MKFTIKANQVDSLIATSLENLKNSKSTLNSALQQSLNLVIFGALVHNNAHNAGKFLKLIRNNRLFSKVELTLLKDYLLENVPSLKEQDNEDYPLAVKRGFTAKDEKEAQTIVCNLVAFIDWKKASRKKAEKPAFDFEKELKALLTKAGKNHEKGLLFNQISNLIEGTTSSLIESEESIKIDS